MTFIPGKAKLAAAVTAESDLLWTAPQEVIRHRDLCVAELPFNCDPLQFDLYWLREADADPANCWMRELVADAFAAGLSSSTPAPA